MSIPDIDISQVKSGNAEAIENLIHLYQQRLFRYCYHMLGNIQEAEDTVQEIFVKMYEKIASYKSDYSFSAWLYKIAHNQCVNILHRRKLVQFIPFIEEVKLPCAGMEDRLERNELDEALSNALKKLSPKDRSIIIMRILEENSYEELAKMLQAKPESIRKRYERARKKLQSLLTVKKEVFPMKDLQPTDDLRQVFNQVHLPAVDVTPQVMEKIFNRTHNHKPFYAKKEFILSMLVSILLISGIAYSAIETFELRGPGNTKYQYQIKEPISNPSSVSKEIDFEEFEKVEPGRAYVTVQPGNPSDNNVEIIIKPLILKNIDEILEKIGHPVKLPEVLPEGYSFKEGHICYDFDNSPESMRKIAQDARNSSEETTHILDTTGKIASLSLVYQKGSTQISVNYRFNIKSDTLIASSYAVQKEVIEINDFQAVYKKENRWETISWLEQQNGGIVHCSVSTFPVDEENSRKEDLIKFAQSLK